MKKESTQLHCYQQEKNNSTAVINHLNLVKARKGESKKQQKAALIAREHCLTF